MSELRTSQEINELATALAEAQGEIQNPSKENENPFFKSKYADLAVVLAAVRPVFSKYGLSVVQLPTMQDNKIGVITRVMHKSGQWLESDLFLELQFKKNIAQEAGAVITYLRRYSLAGAAGVFQEDPDGNLGKNSADNHGEVVTIDNPFEAETLKKFANRMIQALQDDNGHWCIGRSLIVDKDLWIATNNGTRGKGTGYYSSNDKAAFGIAGTKYRDSISEYVDSIHETVNNDDKAGTDELLAELDNETDKQLVWKQLNPDAKSIIKHRDAA